MQKPLPSGYCQVLQVHKRRLFLYFDLFFFHQICWDSSPLCVLCLKNRYLALPAQIILEDLHKDSTVGFHPSLQHWDRQHSLSEMIRSQILTVYGSKLGVLMQIKATVAIPSYSMHSDTEF